MQVVRFQYLILVLAFPFDRLSDQVMFTFANKMRLSFLILLLVKGGNGGPALSAIENAKTGSVETQRDLPNEILLEMDMDTVLRYCILTSV